MSKVIKNASRYYLEVIRTDEDIEIEIHSEDDGMYTSFDFDTIDDAEWFVVLLNESIKKAKEVMNED